MPINATVLANPRSERVRRVAELSNRKARERSGRFIVEGPQSVREAVRHAPDVVRDVYVAVEPARRNGGGTAADAARFGLPVSDVAAPIVDQAVERGLYVHLCEGAVIERMSRDAQGIVAVGDLAAMRRRFGTPDYVFRDTVDGRRDAAGHRDAADGHETNITPVSGRETSPDPEAGETDSEEHAPDGRTGVVSDARRRSEAPTLVAAFWQVRDPGNAGTVIRAADAAGCAAVVFVDDCVDTLNPKVIRSTAGSLFHLPVVTMGTDGFVAWCRDHGMRIIAADVYGTPERRPEPLPDLLAGGTASGMGPAAVLFGNEARGLPQPILRRMDRIVSIPIYGAAESLNLGTSAAVMLMCLAMAARG